jgi:hypothetical protein
VEAVISRFFRKLVWFFVVLLVLGLLIQAALPPFDFMSNPLEANQLQTVAIAAGLAVAFGFLFRRVRWIQHIDTWLHEFGHAVTAAALGAAPSKIRLNSDSSGVTYFSVGAHINKFKLVILSAAGPTASAITFLVAVIFTVRGQAVEILLVSSFIVLKVMLTTVRSLFGWFVGLLVWGSMVLVTSLTSGWFLGDNRFMLQGIFLTVLTGVAAGVALRASVSMLRVNGPSLDEGSIAANMRVPEVLVDLFMIVFNAGLIAYAFFRFDVIDQEFLTVFAPELISSWAQTVFSWLGELGSTLTR